MNVRELFQGIAVIFDDEIDDDQSKIFKIKQLLEEQNIPVATSKEQPSKEMIPSLQNAAFIIVDWNFTDKKLGSVEERILVPDTLRDESEKELIEFIKDFLQRSLVPIFIFTALKEDDIRSKLRNGGCLEDSRVFIKNKEDVDTEEHLFNEMESWLLTMPSVYVLKEWERITLRSKNKMLLRLYQYSPVWAKIVWDMIKADSEHGYQHEFGEFLTRSLSNCVDTYYFDETVFDIKLEEISIEEARKVLEGERFFSYDEHTKPQQAYTGDLIKEGSRYYLNIRAQCDLSRDGAPCYYCLKGEKLKEKDMAISGMEFNENGDLVFGDGEQFSFSIITGIDKNLDNRTQINTALKKRDRKIFFRHGTFLERADHIIIPCIAEEVAIEFKLKDIEIKEFQKDKDKRVGRLLPPYITRIQQKWAHYVVRTGVLPVPENVVFPNK